MSQANYLTYKVMTQPTPPTITDYEVINIVDALIQYYVSVYKGEVHLKDKHYEF